MRIALRIINNLLYVGYGVYITLQITKQIHLKTWNSALIVILWVAITNIIYYFEQRRRD